MKKIFETGDFNRYKVSNLNEAKVSNAREIEFTEKRTTVFISHKHSDLEDLKGIIGFLEKEYNVKAYIDSQDSFLPLVISEETAVSIKERIKRSDYFILLATDGAVESKWCNWELGYGDACKFAKKIALFPMKQKATADSSYKGNEYMSIYPSIIYLDGTETDTDKNLIKNGYYVQEIPKGEARIITPLANWLKGAE